MRAGSKLLLVGALALLFGCHGHRHAQEEERPSAVITHFTPLTELFVEFPALVVGGESPFAAHLTRLDTFKPLAEGRVTVVLSGGSARDERFEVTAPTVPGIFRPVAKPAHAGKRTLSFLIDGEGLTDRHDVGPVEVFASTEAAVEAHEEGEETPHITFLKEQQWRIPFATAEVGERVLRASLRVHGVLGMRTDGRAQIAAPVTGRIVTDPAVAPQIGSTVEPGAELAVIAPRLSTDTDTAELERNVARARRDLEHARAERARIAGLYESDAVPEKRLLEARLAERNAVAELEAAEHRLRQYQGVHQAGDAAPEGRITVRSPIGGTLVRVHVAPGSFVEDGRPLFEVVDLGRLTLEAHVPEADIARVRSATGAWFELDGRPEPIEVTAATGGRLVAFPTVVDPQSRTAPLIFEISNARRELLAGAFAHVHVLTGEATTAPAVPTTAIVDDGGESVAYVEVGGESFERRPLTLGIRDGGYVEIRAGLAPGERVVTRGAYYVRLAASSGAVPAHGHAH